MSTTPIWGIPEIESQQAQPEVTHNEALLLLQILLGGAEGQQNAPPGGPADGDIYIVGAAGSGDWAGRDESVAIYREGAGWRFLPGEDDDGSPIPIGTAHEGLRVWRKDLSAETVWTGSAWEEYPFASP